MQRRRPRRPRRSVQAPCAGSPLAAGPRASSSPRVRARACAQACVRRDTRLAPRSVRACARAASVAGVGAKLDAAQETGRVGRASRAPGPCPSSGPPALARVGGSAASLLGHGNGRCAGSVRAPEFEKLGTSLGSENGSLDLKSAHAAPHTCGRPSGPPPILFLDVGGSFGADDASHRSEQPTTYSRRRWRGLFSDDWFACDDYVLELWWPRSARLAAPAHRLRRHHKRHIFRPGRWVGARAASLRSSWRLARWWRAASFSAAAGGAAAWPASPRGRRLGRGTRPDASLTYEKCM